MLLPFNCYTHILFKLENFVITKDKSNDLFIFKDIALTFAQNSYLYLLVFQKSTSFKWYSVITLDNSHEIIINMIKFLPNGQAIQNYDLNGIKLIGVGTNWMPFYTAKNCDENGFNCENEGIHIDQIKIWAQKYNFTWDIWSSTDWGLYPISGKL